MFLFFLSQNCLSGEAFPVFAYFVFSSPSCFLGETLSILSFRVNIACFAEHFCIPAHLLPE